MTDPACCFRVNVLHDRGDLQRSSSVHDVINSGDSASRLVFGDLSLLDSVEDIDASRFLLVIFMLLEDSFEQVGLFNKR